VQRVREQVREQSEQSWVGAVEAMHGPRPEPPIPAPAFEPAMQVDVPSEQLRAQWKLGAWHILRRSLRDSNGKWSFNDYPFGILASETGMILRALDLQGMHKEAADGLDPPSIPRAKNIIWLFMIGGTSHVEGFDPKPELNKYAGKTIGVVPGGVETHLFFLCSSLML